MWLLKRKPFVARSSDNYAYAVDKAYNSAVLTFPIYALNLAIHLIPRFITQFQISF